MIIKNDLIVHPVRSRIIGALAGRTLTTLGLARVLPDVPKPSLYRHLRLLTDAGLILVVEERQVRGTAERTFALAENAGRLEPNEAMSADGRLRLLTNFTSLVNHSYRIYQESGGEELAVANMAAIYVTEAEDRQLRDAIRRLIEPFANRTRMPGRQRRLFSVIDQPDFEPNESQ